LIVSCKTVDGISDHEAVLVKSDSIVHLADPPARSVYLWSQIDFDNIRHTIQGYCEEFVAVYNTSIPVNVLWNKFLDICNTCMRLQNKFQPNIVVHGLHLA